MTVTDKLRRAELKFDAALCTRLIAEARKDDARMTPGQWIGGADCVVVYKNEHECVAEAVIAEMGEDERHEDNAAGIARARNNLGSVADQLEAGLAEVSALNRHVEDIGKAQDRAEANEKATYEENVDLRGQLEAIKKERDEFLQMFLDARDHARRW